jgi:hypothetical protein
VKSYDLTHQDGVISIENVEYQLGSSATDRVIEGDLGIQIGADGRIWVCINGISFIRFKPGKIRN